MQKRRLHAKEKETDAHLLPPFPQRIFGNAANQGFLGLPQQLLLFYSFSLRRGWEKKNMNNYAMHTREIYLSAYPSCQILTPLYGALSIAAVVRILFISLSLSLFLSLSLLYLYLCSSSVVHAYLQSVDLARGPARENATAGTELFIECNTVCSLTGNKPRQLAVSWEHFCSSYSQCCCGSSNQPQQRDAQHDSRIFSPVFSLAIGDFRQSVIVMPVLVSLNLNGVTRKVSRLDCSDIIPRSKLSASV
jgi:hypothetical protein